VSVVQHSPVFSLLDQKKSLQNTKRSKNIIILLLLYYQSKPLLSKGPESEALFLEDFRQNPIGKKIIKKEESSESLFLDGPNFMLFIVISY